MSERATSDPIVIADDPTSARPTFDDDLAANHAVEKRLVWKELFAMGVVAAIIAVRQLWLS